jgi:hypothetical protein
MDNEKYKNGMSVRREVLGEYQAAGIPTTATLISIVRGKI